MVDVEIVRSFQHLIRTSSFQKIVQWYLDVIKRMMTFTPTTATDGCKLDHRVKWDFNRHALFDTGVTKVCHKTLQYTNMAYNQRRHDFLLDVNNDTG